MPFPNVLAQNQPPPVELKSGDELKSKPVDNYSFDKLKGKVTKLAGIWTAEASATLERRNQRYLNINTVEWRKNNKLKADETYIPIRLINENITKEAPQYIAYLTSSRNAAVFKPKKKTEMVMQVIESCFTKMARFPGWEIPFFKNLDGTQMHGWACVETVFDSDKPGHFAIETIAHEDLWFAKDIDNHQRSPTLARNCKVTREELMKFKDVNQEQVDLLFKQGDEDNEAVESTVVVQKVFYKNQTDGLVYVCWMNQEKSTDFIRPPKPLWLGKKQILIDSLTQQPMKGVDGSILAPKVYETQYPIDMFQYIVSENGQIMETKGRCFYDFHIQEAASSLVSSIVNGYSRASQIMGAPKNAVSTGAVEQTNVKIQAGVMYNNPIEFFNTPYPDGSSMGIVQALITTNKTQTSQVDFAVNNRQDSRKTAKEITAAQSQASLLSGVQVTLYSIFLRNVWTRCWAIAKSQLEQGLIPDSDLPIEYLTIDYELYSAGDSEVITRDEQLGKLQQAWPVFQSTPAAPIILRAIVDLAFPQIAEEVNAILQGTNPANIVASMSAVIGGFIQQYGSAISPEDMQKLQTVMQEAQQYTQQNQPTEEGQPHGEPIEQQQQQQQQQQ